ncbi:MAG TPA: hypothetical protein VK821_14350 [Dehalococcoidia bacterium]|nr:hypothetical protein [Dehalococcoidia bacterium]
MDGRMYLGQPVDLRCPSPRCDSWTGVSVFALPSVKTRWRAVLRCQRGHVWFVAARGLRLIHPHTVRRGPAPGQWEFSAHVDDYALAERILDRWSREHPAQYAAIETRSGTLLGPLLLSERTKG